MAITLVQDLIRDSGLQEQFNGNNQLLYLKIDRSFFVMGLPVGNAADNANVTNAAVAYIKSTVAPVGSAHPVRTEALARSYQFLPSATGTGGEVIVSFIFQGGGFDPTQYTIDITGGLQSTTTDSEFDASNNLIPISVPFWKEWGFDQATGKPGTFPGTKPIFSSGTDMPVLRPLGGFAITRTIYTPAKVAAIETAMDSYLGWTNSIPLRGKPQNTYLCTSMGITEQPFQGSNLARVEFSYNPMGWDAFARFSNTQLGVPPNIWRIQADTYVPNLAAPLSNGIKRCKGYPQTDLNALVTLITT